MKFEAKVYKQNKGPKNQCGYIGIPTKTECFRVGLNENYPMLLKINKKEFVSMIRKMSNKNKHRKRKWKKLLKKQKKSPNKKLLKLL